MSGADLEELLVLWTLDDTAFSRLIDIGDADAELPGASADAASIKGSTILSIGKPMSASSSSVDKLRRFAVVLEAVGLVKSLEYEPRLTGAILSL